LNSFTETNFYFCGDVLQEIYRFRGTSNEYIKALSNTPDWEKIKLFTNYRSTNQICEYANKFSSKYADASYRIEMKGIREGDKVVTKLVDGPSKYDAINLTDIENVLKELEKLQGTSAIICRTNKEVYAITSYLKNHNVDFTTSKDTKIQKLIDCAISDTYALGLFASYLSSNKYGEYIRLSSQTKNPDLTWFLKLYGTTPQIKDDMKNIDILKKIANEPDTTNEKLETISTLFHIKNIKKTDTAYFGEDFLKYLKEAIIDIKSSELYIGTIHSVKGLEYDNVFVMNVGSYNFRLVTEEMKNLFYVAITRAKNRLFIYELFDD
jgi:superfamily I DNA/RNA helicase